MSLGSHCNLICHCYGYSLNISCTLTIINFNYHLHHFSRHKSILRKGHIRTSRSLIDTTTAGNSPRWLSLLRLNYSGLSENDLSSTLDFKLWTHWLNSSNHVIDDDSFLLWTVEIEAGWPSFEGLKAEWETVLSWWETTALIDHRFATSEHVSCFIVFHLIMPVLWSTNVARSMIIFVILLRLTIWDSEVIGVEPKMGWDSCDWIELRGWRRWGWLSRSAWWCMSGCWSMHLFCFEPFHTLVACKFER